MTKIIGTFGSKKWGDVTVIQDEYLYDQTLAISLVLADGEPLATLSIHLDGSSELPKDHFYAKVWSENEEIAEEALASGLFEKTELPSAVSGFVVAPVWRIKA